MNLKFNKSNRKLRQFSSKPILPILLTKKTNATLAFLQEYNKLFFCRFIEKNLKFSNCNRKLRLFAWQEMFINTDFVSSSEKKNMLPFDGNTTNFLVNLQRKNLKFSNCNRKLRQFSSFTTNVHQKTQLYQFSWEQEQKVKDVATPKTNVMY